MCMFMEGVLGFILVAEIVLEASNDGPMQTSIFTHLAAFAGALFLDLNWYWHYKFIMQDQGY